MGWAEWLWQIHTANPSSLGLRRNFDWFCVYISWANILVRMWDYGFFNLFFLHKSVGTSYFHSQVFGFCFYTYVHLLYIQVDHLFKHRINSSAVHASDYLKQFPSPILSIVAKFISFVSGGFAAVLIIIAFLEESLLEGHVKYLNFHNQQMLICKAVLFSFIAIWYCILYFASNLADIWSQLILVCCCIWNYNSYKPGCNNRWASCPWPTGSNVTCCPTYTLYAKEMARERKYWGHTNRVWNFIPGAFLPCGFL